MYPILSQCTQNHLTMEEPRAWDMHTHSSLLILR